MAEPNRMSTQVNTNWRAKNQQYCRQRGGGGWACWETTHATVGKPNLMYSMTLTGKHEGRCWELGMLQRLQRLPTWMVQ